MRITFKTVTNKLFTIDADESETVAGLKKKIEDNQSFAADLQKIIYSGKILKDDATVGGLNIKEKDFLVVMVSKPKAAPAAAAAPAPAASPAPAAAAAPAASESSSAAPAAAASTSAPATEAPAAAAAPAAETTTSAPAATETPAAVDTGIPLGSSFLTGPALTQAVDSLVEMGFPRDQVMRAMRASFNNPDRAAEYLMTGNIPETEAPAPAPAATATSPAAPSRPLGAARAAPAPAPAPAASAPAASGGSADNLFAAAQAAMDRDRGVPSGAGGAAGAGLPSLEEIANSPQMARIREAVHNNPALIQPLLQQIANTNPQLAALINQDPQTLYDLLGLSEDDLGAMGEYEGPQVMQVDLTDEEVAAVERLEQLGFPRQMVLQAFLLCDKNEELAANFLFESTEEDEQMQ